MPGIEFTPTRAAGLERLAAFAPRMDADYAALRNHDFGPDDRSNVSCLSPWIRHRLVSEVEVVDAALARFGQAGAEKFIQEVCWRTYFKGWLEQRPDAWVLYCDERDGWIAELGRDSALRARYDRAAEGRTGIDGFDDWMHELAETGYLHNHARMWFASIWVFTLKLPWSLGADLFLRHLIDADPASNTLSWRWVAGLHTPGKTYLAQRLNIEKYTAGRFAPEGLADDAPPADGFGNPPYRPIMSRAPVTGEPAVLVITEDDLAPEQLFAVGVPITSVCGFSQAEARSPGEIGGPARRFTSGALDDGLRRASAHFGVPSRRLSGVEDLACEIAGEAERTAVNTIVLPWVPVGWTRPVVDALMFDLRTHGLRCLMVRRDWDEAFWPHAKAGFFQLRKRIPDLLAGRSSVNQN